MMRGQLLLWLLLLVVGMAGEFGGGGFLAGIGAIVGGIAATLRSFIAITAKDLLRLVKFLKEQLVDLAKALLNGVFRLGRALARALVSFVRLAGLGLKRFVLWANKKLLRLEKFLKDFFAPLLKRLKQLKEHIDDIYKRFVRPIIDTIEFIRNFNRILQLFHVKVLAKLDATLAQIEQAIEGPFLFIRQHITEIENWINRIVTLDGLFQRLTLLRSLARYAGGMTNVWWNAQRAPAGKYNSTAPPASPEPITVTEITAGFTEAIRDDSGPFNEGASRVAAALREELV